jgi:hypothetical protein
VGHSPDSEISSRKREGVADFRRGAAGKSQHVDLVGIDMPLFRMGTNQAHGALCIFQCLAANLW